MQALREFREVWALDFEFGAPPGAHPEPRCLVARELFTGRVERLWLDGCPVPICPPYGTGPDTLLIAYYSSAEWGCHLALDWPLPERVLDLFTEFRCLTNGRPLEAGAGLLGALVHFGLDAMDAHEKEEMRTLALRGGPYTDAEAQALLDYCQSDVDALARFLPKMLPRIDLPRALLRGRYMVAAARMEWTGVPLDVEALDQLRHNWNRIKGRLTRRVDENYGVFVPADQAKLDPDSDFGQAVLSTASDWGLDPHRLAEAATDLWRRERESTRDRREGIAAARKVTGLTAAKVGRIVDVGGDHLAVGGLDVTARELARSYPGLLPRTGYDAEAGYDDFDYGAALWELLALPDEKPRPRTDPTLLREAAEEVVSCPEIDERRPLRFDADRWTRFVTRRGIPWPKLPSGRLALDDDTFREAAKAYPDLIGPIRELRHALGQMRLNDLASGPDGRNRCMLSAFRSTTGRNQPSNSTFIFGPSSWLRSLIRPGPGRAVAYVDWSQQELAIAARLSRDERMQECYVSGDFYLTFAKMANAVPHDATKQTHGTIRDQFKVVSLGVLYGLSAAGMARKIGVTDYRGRQLLEMHRRTFPRFWSWSDALLLEAFSKKRLQTCFGWTLHVGNDANPRSLKNFPMQAHGAEMMRVACIMATERGVNVCCPVHDALLVEGAADDIDDVVRQTQDAMRQASEVILPGFPLKTDAKIVRYPDRYTDPRGVKMWGLVWDTIATEPLPNRVEVAG